MIEPRLSLADPGNSASLLAAITWVRVLITGTTATVIATIAVAGVGFVMLQGRLPLRRGAVVVMGCFVIFGANAIAEGLMAVGKSTTQMTSAIGTEPLPLSPRPVTPPQPSVYDPYAGASVPTR